MGVFLWARYPCKHFGHTCRSSGRGRRGVEDRTRSRVVHHFFPPLLLHERDEEEEG